MKIKCCKEPDLALYDHKELKRVINITYVCNNCGKYQTEFEKKS
jgi:hypothetical protein